MTAYLNTVAGVLIAAVLGVVLSRQGKDISLLLSLAVCCMVLLVAVRYLEPVMEFLDTLATLSNLDNDLMNTMLKVVGIGLIAELASLICADSGNSAMGKAVEFLAAGAVLWLSIPMMTTLLELIQQIVGQV